ncbi:MAG: hypothetical protein JWM95_1736 [Gemmatimonadetes bacterium]|nr:hypothetical protein [Gemmatimonadota bacterium]
MIETPFGYIKLSRKAFDADQGDAFWHERRVLSRWEAWVYLIQLASFAPRRYQTAFGPVDLERGELVVSLRKLAADFMWSLKSVRGWVGTCQKGARIRAQRETPAGIVYLIVNYDAYQLDGTAASDGKGTAKGTARAQQGHKREEGKEGKAITALSDDVETVIAKYLELHPSRRPDEKARKLVARALKHYSATELCEALIGNATDDWNVKRNKHELAWVLKDNGAIDTFRALAAKVTPAIVDEFGVLTEYGERVTRPGKVNAA